MSAARRSFLIGARGSPLSLAQTGHVRDLLAAANPDATFEIVAITTTGDKIQDRALTEMGGKGLFTKELDDALLGGRIDLAVHSMKDLPTELPEGVVLACTPPREDPRDVLVSGSEARSVADLPKGARIGTASLRRQAQLLALRPDLRISILRGNVETRLAKVAAGEVDATLLACAGLKRLGLERHARTLLEAEECLPAVGQGALAITARADDGELLERLGRIADPAAAMEIAAERAFLEALDGSCRTPIAALAKWDGAVLHFIGEALSPDGAYRWRREERAEARETSAARALGRRHGASVRAEAGERLYKPPHP